MESLHLPHNVHDNKQKKQEKQIISQFFLIPQMPSMFILFSTKSRTMEDRGP